MMASQPIQLDSGRRLARWMALMLFVALLSAGFGVWYFYFDSPSFMEVVTSTEDNFDSDVVELELRRHHGRWSWWPG